MARKLSDTVKLNLRFSEDLRRKLEKAADKNGQSMNLEIVERLEESFRRQDWQAYLDAHAKTIAQTVQENFQKQFGGTSKGLMEFMREQIESGESKK